MKYLISLIAVCILGCSSYTQVIRPNGHMGYNFQCDSVRECYSISEELCGNLGYKFVSLDKLQSNKHIAKIECVSSNVDWGNIQ